MITYPGGPKPSRVLVQSLIREPSPDCLIDWCHWLTQKDRPRVFHPCVPGVVGIGSCLVTGGVHQKQNVALQVQDIVIGCCGGPCGIVQHEGIAALIVEEVQLIGCSVLRIGLPQQLAGGVNVVMPDAVHELPGPQAADVVVIVEGNNPV